MCGSPSFDEWRCYLHSGPSSSHDVIFALAGAGHQWTAFLRQGQSTMKLSVSTSRLSVKLYSNFCREKKKIKNPKWRAHFSRNRLFSCQLFAFLVGWIAATRSSILPPSSTNAIKGATFWLQFESECCVTFQCVDFADAEVAEQERPSIRLLPDESDKIVRAGATFQIICEADFNLDWKLPSILETRDYVIPQKPTQSPI